MPPASKHLFVDEQVVAAPPHSRLPRLDLGIDWVPRWEEFRSSVQSALGGPKPEGNEAVSGGDDLQVEWVRAYRPRSPFLVALLGHAAAIWLITLPIWGFLPQTHAAPMEIEMSWDVADLPAISLPARTEQKPVRQARANDPSKEPRREQGADAFHPRQTILSLPIKLTHPRQTLIQPDAPAKAPTIVEPMPNIVEWSAPHIERPQIQYPTSDSKPEFRQARRRVVAAPEIAENAKAAELLGLTQPKEWKLAPPAPQPSPGVMVERRARRHDAMAAPQLTENTKGALLDVADTAAVHLAPPAPVPSNSAVLVRHRAAPEVGAAPEVVASGNSAQMQKLIALSANPAPPRPAVMPPAGNLAARVAISPEGRKSGALNGKGPEAARNATATASGSSPVAISVSGPNAKPSSTSGLSERVNPTVHLDLRIRPTMVAPDSGPSPTIRTEPANVATLAPGAPPEQLLSGKVFSMHVSTPNTTSTLGSWAVSFSELGADPRRTTKPDDTLSGPEPIYTVDPKYPPETMAEHITGEVVLYAIIRKDGSVDSVQLVRSLDPRLDKAAMEAFAQWKFRPGSRAGVPVDIEAVIHVPFEYRELNY